MNMQIRENTLEIPFFLRLLFGLFPFSQSFELTLWAPFTHLRDVEKEAYMEALFTLLSVYPSFGCV